MKCVQNAETKEIKRLSDDEAHFRVRKNPHIWKYVTKTAYKKQLAEGVKK